MAKMGGVNEHLGGVHVGNNGAGGSFPNDATLRRSMSKGGVNKDLGGGWADKSQSPALGVGQQDPRDATTQEPANGPAKRKHTGAETA